MNKEIFQNKLNKYKIEIKNMKRKSNIFGMLRLISIVISFIALYFYYSSGSKNIILLLSCFAGGIIFLYCVHEHNKTRKKVYKLKELIEVNKKYIKRFEGTWIEFADKGNEFLDKEHKYSSDLDIFGAKSLFQLINSTRTTLGRNRLASLLKNGKRNGEEIVNRQSAVEEISKKIEFCENMASPSEKYNGEDGSKELIDFLESNEKTFRNLNLRILINGIHFLDIIIIGLTLFYRGNFILTLLILLFYHGVFAVYGLWKSSNSLSEIFKFKDILEEYRSLIMNVKNEDFKDKHLIKMKSELFNGEKNVQDAIDELEKIINKIQMRYNILSFIIFNIILLGDFRCVMYLERWRKDYKSNIKRWFEVINEFECIISFSVLVHTNDKVSYPKIHENGTMLKSLNLGHPLIKNEERVCNNVDLSNRIFVITGSNMSGKTTFLRTIGVNLVLAYAGAPVCAEDMECSIMDINTSMRIEDDLNAGISTFYAELKRIKKIIDSSNKEKNMIFLIDEIFRGTNSNDRILGAKSVLHKLNQSWIIGGISTHDFELCKLEGADNNRIANYHFEESYENNKIKFDYKLKAGKSTTANAQYLMKLIGIDIITD
ncbi:MutS-related protein [Oceanirhabdus sp. W0125-5]|uniref:MutS-related protein n=1 Tax=Oceanirhabdus sp. W0125-5 TaxID=2999116 RepID=UPI0022F2E07C|nr:MutS family DNA mismatch repair protein [Oceanirhabdus sp. W0125-5]WBW94686.1 MutS family DNA mismatch repair protein [Oceanirhabdus sp. W0125-5]